MQVKSPNKLNDESFRILTARLADEYAAHYFYRNATNWCQGVGYVKAAAYFAEEAETELKHAEGIQRYITDWNRYPQLPSIKPNITFSNLIDIVNKAYAMEYALWESYCEDSKQLFNTDINTFDFMTAYRVSQNQSVIEYSDLLSAAELVDVDDNYQVLYYEQTYFAG
jgi:ferritin